VPGKSALAFRTIGELAAELNVPQHILRYWETRFPQLKPLQRAGNRRYYRPDDVALARRIHRLLNQEGYTIKGVQRVLADGAAPPEAEAAAPAHRSAGDGGAALQALRATLARALDESRA
jgi:DNA-binding transcriptional MerR regulator